MIINLRDYSFNEIYYEDQYKEYRDPSTICNHLRRKIGQSIDTIYLRCIRCRDIRAVHSPRFIRSFIKNKNKERPVKQRTPVKLSAVDRKHAQKMIDNYEGDPYKDLLQPFNIDGSPNEEFIKTYGHLPKK